MKKAYFILLACFFICLIGLIRPGRTFGYDYSEKMTCYTAKMGDGSTIAIQYPEQPFVLRFSREELLAQPIWSRQVDGILIPKGAPSPIMLGAEALRDSIAKLKLGTAPIIEVDPAATAFPGNAAGKFFILLGVPEDFKLAGELAAAQKLNLTDKAVNGDGFAIRPLVHEGRQIVLIASPVNRGVMYGAYELEERTTKRGVPKIDKTFVPAIRYRAVGDIPYGRSRPNLDVKYDFYWAHLLFYKDFPELGGEQEKATILSQQKKLHDQFADSARYGVLRSFMWNPLHFDLTGIGYEAAKPAIAKAHPGILAEPWPGEPERRNMCPSNPATKKFVESSVREMIQTFPEMDMLMMYFSDERGELLCGCDKCNKYPFLDRVTDYATLMMKTARSVNPKIRFTMRIHALNWWIPLNQPEYKNDPSVGFHEIVRRLGPDLEGVTMRPTTPPGGDYQSWLAPDSTMLGQGVPLIFELQYYEAGGPGIVDPISPIMTHLSWDLPIYLKKMDKYLQPGQGMVGSWGATVAGLEVACWDPKIDPYKYMKNWCVAKYGPETGGDVYKGLADTYKITELFFPETKKDCIESCDLFRWGTYGKPYAVSMKPMEKAWTPGDAASAERFKVPGYPIPQAPQPEGLAKVTTRTMGSWIARFNAPREIEIAERSHRMMAKALAREPQNKELKRLEMVSQAGADLVRLYKDYHLAMVYSNAAKNNVGKSERQKLIRLASGHMKKAIVSAYDYTKNILPPVEEKGTTSRLRSDVKNMCTYHVVCMVREGAFLMDKDFGGEGLLSAFDTKFGIGEK